MNPSKLPGWLLGTTGGIAAFLLLAATSPTVGVTWDEPIFSVAAERAAGWLGLVAQGRFAAAADPYTFGIGWGLVNEHPPLMRILNGIGWALGRGWLPAPLVHRLGSIALAAVALGVLVGYLRRERGLAVGLFAGAGLLGMPRLFFHMNLAALDFPLAAVWTLATLIFYQQMAPARPKTRAFFVVGAWIGLALLTKINAVLLLPFWGLWLLIFRRTWRHLLLFAAAQPVALLVLVGGWPWIWKDPIGGLIRWVEFFQVHFDIGQWYAGQLYQTTPWHAPFAILLMTTPGPLLGLALLGGWASSKTPAWAGLHLLGMGTVLGYYALPITSIHDQDRLLLPAFVHLAIFSAEGFGWLWQKLAARLPDGPARARVRAKTLAAALLAGLLLGPGVADSVRLHPFQLAYYNRLVGGLPGARQLGMETIYFASTYGHFLPALNRLSPNSTIWLMPNSWGVLYYYQQAGLLRTDLTPLRPPGWGSFYDDAGVPFAVGTLNDAEYALIERRQTGFHSATPQNALQLDWAANRPLLLGLERDGVVLATLHARE